MKKILIVTCLVLVGVLAVCACSSPAATASEAPAPVPSEEAPAQESMDAGDLPDRTETDTVVDFTEIVGVWTPDQVSGEYGPPTAEDGSLGKNASVYQYRNANFLFVEAEDGSGLVLDAVAAYRPQSPVTVGGVRVAMTPDDAAKALTATGFEQSSRTDKGNGVYVWIKQDGDNSYVVKYTVEDDLVSSPVYGYLNFSPEDLPEF